MKCPRCSGDMQRRTGRLGDFWGCLRYPECTGTRELIVLPEPTSAIGPDKRDTPLSMKATLGLYWKKNAVRLGVKHEHLPKGE